MRLATGGGPQTSHEELKLYAKCVGDLKLRLLERCPLAMSIGQQIEGGRTFIWRHGVLDHKKCKVWRPLEHRWFAKRVRNNVPIFAIEPQQLKDQPAVAALTKAGGEQEDQAAAVCQQCADGLPAMFYEDCIERKYACVCHLGDVIESFYAAASAPLREDHASVKVCVDAESQKEHVRRRHRKDDRRRKWEAAKLAKQPKDSDDDIAKKIDGGDGAVDKILKDLLDVYRSPGLEKTESEKEVYRNMAERVHNEQHDYQEIAAEIAVPDPHHQDLPGHGMLIEFCTSEESAIGRIGHQYDVCVIRCTETTLNADDPATERRHC